MKRFVLGADRRQSTLLPECLDEENPVRVIDAFVDALDLVEVYPVEAGSYHSRALTASC
jgi:hypothetical protein